MILGKIEESLCALSRSGSDRDSERKVCKDPLAEIESDPACAFIESSVKSGVTFFKDPWKVFRVDPDPAVFDHQRIFLIFVHIDTDESLFGVF